MLTAASDVMELIWNKIKNPLKNLFGNDIQHGSVFYDGDSTEQYALVATSHGVLEFEHKKSVALLHRHRQTISSRLCCAKLRKYRGKRRQRHGPSVRHQYGI